MGVLVSDEPNPRREARVEQAIIKFLETEIPAAEFIAARASSLKDYIDFRVEHLKKRHASGELFAYIRLTEIEALKDFVKKFVYGGEQNS